MLKHLIINITLSKNQRVKTMDATPNGEPLTIDFADQVIFLSESAPGIINMAFDDLNSNMRHEAKEYPLAKINYRTILAALRGSHPQIISATLNLNSDQIYELIVKVSYEYLPEMSQKIVFEKREIAFDETEQANMRNMRNHLRMLRDQLNALGNIQILSGKLDENSDTEIYQRLGHKRTVFTWGLNIRKSNNTVLKPQMFYYSSITKQRKSSGAVSDQGVYLHTSGEASYIQLKFLAELEDFDMVIFKLPGSNTGEYTITNEKVEIA